MSALDAYKIRQDFAILDQVVNDEPLVYLDNAATTQKPQVVLDTLMAYYREENANVHRGVHTLAERATAAYEASREKIRQFISAKSTKEILFTRGTTTGLNWVGRFAEQVLEPGDEVVISIMEHHSNIIPWQEACKKAGAKLVYAYLKDGQLDMEDLANKISEKTKFVSLLAIALGMALILISRTEWLIGLGCIFIGFGYGVIQPIAYDKTTRTAIPEKVTLALAFVMAMNYLAILLCPFIIDFFQSMLHVKSQQFAFIFNLCIALVATIWAYVKRDSFLFNDKI